MKILVRLHVAILVVGAIGNTVSIYAAWHMGLVTHLSWRNKVNPNIIDTLILYRDHGKHPGNFLFQVLTNNLTEAMSAADDDNVIYMREIIRFIHDELPWASWSTEHKVRSWIKSGGLITKEQLFKGVSSVTN
jgi:hypothetical protein